MAMESATMARAGTCGDVAAALAGNGCLGTTAGLRATTRGPDLGGTRRPADDSPRGGSDARTVGATLCAALAGNSCGGAEAMEERPVWEAAAG